MAVDDILHNALNNLETSNYSLPLTTKTGRVRELLINASTRRDADGHIIGVVGVAQDVTEQNAGARKAETLALELQSLIDNANAPIFGIDMDGNVNEWNVTTVNITGFSRVDAIGKPLVQTFIDPQHRMAVNSILTDALRGVETSNYSLPLRTHNGRVRELLINASTRRDVDGHVIGVVGVAQDVTEQNAGARKAETLALELQSLIDNANAPVFGINVDGNVNEWNVTTVKITGFSRADAIGKPLVQTFIDPERRAEVDDILRNALNCSQTSNYSLPLTTKDGRVRELLINASTRRDADGHVVGVVGVAQDVTKENEQRRKAQVSAAELQSLIDTANAPIFGMDVFGNVNEWNNAIVRVTGIARGDIMGKPFVGTLIDDENQEDVQSILSNSLKGLQSSDYALSLTTKNGDTRQLLLNTSTRRNATNDVIGVFGVAQDITERRLKDKELEQQRLSTATREARITAETDFNNHMAHEIRNPLSGIDNCSLFLNEALNTLYNHPSLDDAIRKLVFSGNESMVKDLSQIRNCMSYIQGILNNTLDL